MPIKMVHHIKINCDYNSCDNEIGAEVKNKTEGIKIAREYGWKIYGGDITRCPEHKELK